MSFKVTFHSDSAFKANFIPQADIKAKFGEFIEVPFVDYYDGEYTVTPTEEQQTIPIQGKTGRHDMTVDGIPSDYVGSAVPRINVAYPSITIKNSTGVASCSVTMSDGYTQGGTTGAALQLTTQSATTITPSAVQQTAVPAYRWTTGAVIVDPIPSNYGLITWDGSTLTVS